MDKYEILDFGNIHELQKQLDDAKKELANVNEQLANTTNELENIKKINGRNMMELRSLQIRHKILKEQQKGSNRITTNTRYLDGKIITTTRSHI